MAESSGANASPWRALFETVREAVGTRRDEQGVLGSINWLRRQMEARGANPNVVRNIIYRDKGRLADKKVLFDILKDLWTTVRDEPLHAPDIELLLSPHASAEQEILQVLGREKRKAFRSFVHGVREGDHPKLLVTGRPGSGKTMLTDYIQQALHVSQGVPVRTLRVEFGTSDLDTTLLQLGEQIGMRRDELEARLAKIAAAGAYAVQADTQAEFARALIDEIRQADPGFVLLLHVSQPLAAQDSLADVPLRLNTPDVPRLTAPEWLWVNLLEPLARLSTASVLASMTDRPARALNGSSSFDSMVKLTPPNAGESRRFVKARLPHLGAGEQEEIVQRAGRSFEELRTMTLLAEIRAPLPEDGEASASIARLSDLVTTSRESRLRDFLAALATVSLPAFPTFPIRDLTALRPPGQGSPNDLERAFIDAVPGDEDDVRCFSRRLVRALRERLAEDDPARHRRLHTSAAEMLADDAFDDPGSVRAARYVHHLFEARSWDALVDWMQRFGAPVSLIRNVWEVAEVDLAPADADTFERLAEQVAAHYVGLGAFRHPDARGALEVLAASEVARRRSWSIVKQAEGAVVRGRYEDAEALLRDEAIGDDELLAAEEALVRASIARWRGELETAARIVEEHARPRLSRLDASDAAVRLARAKAAMWAGLIHMDRGDLEAAAEEFDGVEVQDDLVAARVAFQAANVALALGRFGAARGAFDDAVELGDRSGALGSERARYVARRGALRLRSGDLDAARADHDAAVDLLEASEGDTVERAFWRARVDVERAEAWLAIGWHDPSIELLDRAITRFRAYGEARGVDAEYRIDRATLRLATAYLARSAGIAWRLPLPIRPIDLPRNDDAGHALALLARVAERVPEGTEDAQVPDALARRALLLASTVEDASRAATALDRAERLTRCPHDEAESAAFRAALALRSDDGAGARSALRQAGTVLDAIDDPVGDPGLAIWLATLDVQATIASGEARDFDRALDRMLSTSFSPFFVEHALRAVGAALERHDRRAWLDRSGVPSPLRVRDVEQERVRLGDRLASAWRAGLDRAPATVEPPV